MSSNAATDWLLLIADPIRVHILRSLYRSETASAVDLHSNGAASRETLRRHLEALVALDVLRRHPGESDGLTPGRPATRFSLNPEVRAGIGDLFESA